MKKFIQAVFVCSMIAAIPLTLFVASVYPSFQVRVSRWDNRTCARTYEGISKGTIWENGEWHHYVDFELDNPAPAWSLRVTEAPVDSAIWSNYSFTSSPIRRVAYRWPSNWWDPFPASAWKICLLSS